MSVRPADEKLYLDLAELFISHPDQPIGSDFLAGRFGDGAVGAMNVIGESRSAVSKAIAAFDIAEGVLYRTAHGKYVFDSAANIEYGRGIVRNTFPVALRRGAAPLAPHAERRRTGPLSVVPRQLTEHDTPVVPVHIFDPDTFEPAVPIDNGSVILGRNGDTIFVNDNGTLIVANITATLPGGTAALSALSAADTGT